MNDINLAVIYYIIQKCRIKSLKKYDVITVNAPRAGILNETFAIMQIYTCMQITFIFLRLLKLSGKKRRAAGM